MSLVELPNPIDSPPTQPSQYAVESGVYPEELRETDRWFVWADSDGRKIPRAPWENPDMPGRYVSWKDEELWRPFGEAMRWVEVETPPGAKPATCLPPMSVEENDTGRVIFIDCDNVRDRDTGVIHPDAWDMLRDWDVYVALSTSGTGLHGFGYAPLPEGYKPTAVTSLKQWPFSDDPKMEVYAGDRFVAATGEHIEDTPTECKWVGVQIREFFKEHGEKAREYVTDGETGGYEPDNASQTEETYSSGDSTGDVEEVFAALDRVRPRDIRLRSTLTNERGDGSKELDPSWATSKSGTRLAQVSDGFIYREGMVGLSPLELVALEEGIIASVGDYPSGSQFWDAVEALRDRGADIPEYERSEKKSELSHLEEISATSATGE